MADPNTLYHKYIVRRAAGGDRPSQKHHGCQYFVLDLTHDPDAVAAAQYYATRTDNPSLSHEMQIRAERAGVDTTSEAGHTGCWTKEAVAAETGEWQRRLQAAEQQLQEVQAQAAAMRRWVQAKLASPHQDGHDRHRDGFCERCADLYAQGMVALAGDAGRALLERLQTAEDRHVSVEVYAAELHDTLAELFDFLAMFRRPQASVAIRDPQTIEARVRAALQANPPARGREILDRLHALEKAARALLEADVDGLVKLWGLGEDARDRLRAALDQADPNAGGGS